MKFWKNWSLLVTQSAKYIKVGRHVNDLIDKRCHLFKKLSGGEEEHESRPIETDRARAC